MSSIHLQTPLPGWLSGGCHPPHRWPRVPTMSGSSSPCCPPCRARHSHGCCPSMTRAWIHNPGDDMSPGFADGRPKRLQLKRKVSSIGIQFSRELMHTPLWCAKVPLSLTITVQVQVKRLSVLCAITPRVMPKSMVVNAQWDVNYLETATPSACPTAIFT